MPSPEVVKVWADGWGCWHARIIFPTGVRPSKQDMTRCRAKARRNIRRQLAIRGDMGPGWPCRVTLNDTATDHDGLTHSVTFKERADA